MHPAPKNSFYIVIIIFSFLHVVNRLQVLAENVRSFPRDKRRRNMVDALFRHFDHVETHGDIFPCPHQKIAGDIDVSFPLMAFHGLGGSTEPIALPRLYFAEHHCVPVARNDVRLSVRGAVVSFEDLVPLFFQVVGCRPFSCPSERFFMNVLR